MIAKITVSRPIKTHLDYSIPEELITDIQIGHRVVIPLRNTDTIGYVVGIVKSSRIKKIKKIKKLLDKKPYFDKKMIRLGEKIARYYYCSMGEALEAMVPSGLKRRKVKIPQVASGRKIETPLKNKAAPAKQLKHSKLSSEITKRIIKKLNKAASKDKQQPILYEAASTRDKFNTYLEIIPAVLRRGFSVIVLTPDIAAIKHFQARLAQKMAWPICTLHSSQKISQLRENLDTARRKTCVVLGSRQALFAPVNKPGLIIVDDEDSDLFKSDESPKIDARRAAGFRADIQNTSIIYASTGCSLESYHNARSDKYIFFKDNTKNKISPEQVDKIDLNQIGHKHFSKKILTDQLKRNMEASFKNGKKVLLLLNRRGFATYISCQKCKHIASCPRCGVSLTYHYSEKKLKCHHCSYSISPEDLCPQCKSGYLKYQGFGTEKLESDLARLYPEKSIERVDTDVIGKKGKRQSIIDKFNRGKIDIIVGTQAVFSGLNLDKLGLIGVISADSYIYMADFRSQEKAFILLYKIIKETIRQDRNIKTAIQTYLPDGMVIKTAAELSYEKFYNNEIKQRRELNLPPFFHFCYLGIRGKKKEAVIKKAEELNLVLGSSLKGNTEIEIIPADSGNVRKIRGNYFQNIAIKTKKLDVLYTVLDKVMARFKKTSGLVVTVDIDAL